MKLVLASSNAGKLAELRDLLGDAGIDLHAQSEFGVEDAEETGLTFVENAILKARHAARATGLPALADDSGLCCVALEGVPGVRSARFAGEPGDEQRNNVELLRRLEGASDRRAHYVCVLVLTRGADDPEPLIAEGRWHGAIARTPRGDGGFGYDHLFKPLDGGGRSAAELDAAEKNRISHRGQALRELVRRLRDDDGGW